MAVGVSAWWKEDRLEAHGEKLLQDLVNQEKSLVARVDDARAKAKAVIDQAQNDAAAAVAAAKEKAEQLARSEAEAGNTEAQAAQASIVSAAKEAAQALKLRADAHREAAVKSVLEKVLP